MKNYLDKKGILHSFDEDIQDELLERYIKERDLTAATDAQVQAIQNPKPTPEQLAAAARKIRDEKLAELDGLTVPLRWETYTEAFKQAYRSYRIALLNVPTQPKFPEEIDWPIKP